ncbi:hypothetical protein CSC94_12660 [Zhengella mangrovi]|uniref:NusG-like N-terminal domain-containing protein n=2 Tax=Zhengella mangrovi TaxID=1982044 RepID=A0A2G1QLX9_9HYPH|nr:hypothetical protein CSC94_12660 [Zhengella mangrovi]
MRYRGHVGPRGGFRLERYSDETERTAIEAALDDAGIEHYLPTEKREIRQRAHTNKFKDVRHPLIPGYCFVRNPPDFMCFDSIPGVIGVLGIRGEPSIIHPQAIAMLKNAEAENAELLEKQKQKRHEAQKKLTRARASQLYPVGSRIKVQSDLLGIVDARITSVTGRKTVKAVAEFLNGLVDIEVRIDQISDVA